MSFFKKLFSKHVPAAAEHPFLPAHIQAGNTMLIRNGMGTRTRFGVQVYDAALYLTAPARAAEDALHMSGPKQLRFIARRALSGSTLGSALLTGMRANSPVGQEGKYLPQMDNIVEVFKSQDQVDAGHTFSIDLDPQYGATFFIDESMVGKSIQVPGFNEAVLQIWLGANPADPHLKTALLKGSD